MRGLLALVFLAFGVVGDADAGDWFLTRFWPPPLESGGADFVARCPKSQNLVGLDLWTRDAVDALQPVCADAYDPTHVGALQSRGPAFGGSTRGANFNRLLCPANAPVITGMAVAWMVDETYAVSNVRIFCGVVAVRQGPSGAVAASFDGRLRKNPINTEILTNHCPKNLVAVGVHGTMANWIHSLGLICGEPAMTAAKVGRVKPPPTEVQIDGSPVPGGAPPPGGSAGSGAKSGPDLKDQAKLDSKLGLPKPATPAPLPVVMAFTGTWDSLTDGKIAHEVRLTQAGDNVTGSFVGADGSVGKITGKLNNGVLRFSWQQTDGNKGSGRFELTADGKQFTGGYGFTTNPDKFAGTWKGTRR